MTENLPPLDLAPGCFGLAMTFVADSAECTSCEFKTACEPIHIRRKENLHSALGIKGKLKKKTSVIGSIVAKTLSVIDTDVTEKISNGINPFDSRFPKLRLATHIIINMDDKVTDNILTSAFESKMGMSKNNAKNATSYVTTVLYATNSIIKQNGKIKIRRATNGS